MSVIKDMSIIKDIMIALEFKAIDYYKISGKWPFWYDDAMAWLREQYEQTSPVLSNSLNIGKMENKGNEVKISPKWSKEDEEEFKIAIETLYEAGQHSSAMWLKSLKQRIAQ